MTGDIKSLRLHKLRVPLLAPYRLAFGVVETYDTIVLETADTEGRLGFGEATILAGYAEETIDQSWPAAKQLGARLPGLDAVSAAAAIRRFGLKFPFAATAFGTALEMLQGSEALQVAP